MFKFIKNFIFTFKYKRLVKKLEKNIDSGKLILTTDKDRGIGKTTALLKIAYDYGLPIITYSKSWANELTKKLDAMIPEYSCYTSTVPDPKAYSCQNLDSLRGIRFYEGVLIEEGVSEKTIIDLQRMGIKIRTGFYYSNFIIK